MIREAIKRHRPCPCGSGLKFKKCHGDEVLRQRCQQIASLYLLHEITGRRLKAGVIEREEHDVLRSRASTTIIEMVVGDEHKAVESEDRKRELAELQESLTRCPKCGRPIPAGTKCIKCSKEVTGEQRTESSEVLQDGSVAPVDSPDVPQEPRVHP